MDTMRALRLTKQIESQQKIKKQYEKEGNQIGAQAAKRKIKQLQEELDRLV